ncbi:lytic transglycosylase domain-containing protein [Serratia rhizosphaerae]|uniref:Lytic transglycosylase domain-containing protein n=1 Tax=Serratia rhizosphaerae TaxID=2597702 RepID=A0ABX6GNL6_9GAMM|nr:transglycosylase SLT domain-containing protein [Serratia rhizosphaerae]QHA87881.1 lytic transglycosylase domain-containing protein [Serratia rhizosphaerae]
MLSVSSNPVPQPFGQSGDFSNLSDNLSQKPVLNASDNGAPLPISYGGAQGTNMDSLLGGGDIQQQLQSAISGTLMQMLFSQLMPQFMQLAQQLLSNSQNGGSQTPQQQGSASTPGVTPQSTPETTGATENSTPAAGSGSLHLPEALKPYEDDIQNAADKTGVPAEVLAAQIWQESRGNLGASTVNGGNGLQDSGLMQVNSNTFADLQSKNPGLLGPDANPNSTRDNIMAGALYMKEQLNAFDGNMGAALRAYNSGPNNVNLNDLSDISKTGTGDATYVDKVLNFANIIKTGQGELPA